MDRRSILKKGLTAGAALGTVALAACGKKEEAGAGAGSAAAPAVTQQRIEWRMVTTWPKNFPGLGVGAENLAKRITEMSGGRLTVRVFAAGEMVPPLQALDAVIEGTAEMSHGAAYYWQNKNPGLSFFTGVPFGMTSRELAAWVRFMGGQALWDEVYDGFGVQGFLSGDTGTQAGGWFRKDINSPADIRGLRFRTPGLGGQVWQKLGASVTNMAAGEIFQALQSGTLDAAEFVGPYNDLALGFYQICKNYYFPSFIEPGLATELVVNKSKFSALPADLQAIVRYACQAAYDDVACDMAANDPRALASLVRDHGVQVKQFPEELLAAGAKASLEVLQSIRDSDNAMAKKVAEGFVSSFNVLRTKTDGTESPFLRAREKYFTLS
ncbi:TRAP transporter substrate-binding protein [Corticibacter populi]|uniref:TRAP transporter substrate-binding protein n=1 Tax=Corticibacter populi TaxID=1550736 RepID=A0A3M6R0D2_9BURK|nr:TRAP transporter substrate-binding protein [Corticibacter populi]RMX08339.1 TRAP transporter substrate-binding protein [Corticibacter populi]RZS35631.1 TRAP-type mannitol/chloroaromatic compound transport system substrate-binding protein [Corticibacter populi]